MKCTYRIVLCMYPCPLHVRVEMLKNPKSALEEYVLPLRIKYTEQYCGGRELYRVAQKSYDTDFSLNIQVQATVRHSA
jgi:hypothetical protein